MAPALSYEAKLQDGQVVWTTEDNGQPHTLTREPGSWCATSMPGSPPPSAWSACCRSELAREERKNTALNQTVPVIANRLHPLAP